MKKMKDDLEFQEMISKKGLKKNFLQEVSNRWKELSEEEKQPYYDEQKRHMDQYYMELDRFKQYVEQNNQINGVNDEDYEHE